MPVIPATQETEIRRTTVGRQPGQIVPRDPISGEKKNSQKRAGGVAQDIGPELKPQYGGGGGGTCAQTPEPQQNPLKQKS
jgi:hypothetical protein